MHHTRFRRPYSPRLARASFVSLGLLGLLVSLVACEFNWDEPPSSEGSKGAGASGRVDADESASLVGCTLDAESFPEDLGAIFAQLGEEFRAAALPAGFAGCLVEPTGSHRSFVCADSKAVVSDNVPAGQFALFIEVGGETRSFIASTRASSEELQEALSCCERRETRNAFFAGDSDAFYRCGDVEVAFGTPSQTMLSDDQLAVVVREAGFDLNSMVAGELGGHKVRVGGMVYSLDHKETSDEIALVSGTTRRASPGHEFVSVFYTLESGKPERTVLSHDRVKLLDGRGTVFEPIADARTDREEVLENPSEPRSMTLMYAEKRNLEDVFEVPTGMLGNGFGVRFYGVRSEHADRFVLGERRWISLGEPSSGSGDAAPGDVEPSPKTSVDTDERPEAPGSTPTAE